MPNVFDDIDNAPVRKEPRPIVKSKPKNTESRFNQLRKRVMTKAMQRRDELYSRLKKHDNKNPQVAKGLKQKQNRSLGYPRNYKPGQDIVISDQQGNYPEQPKPYHVEMREHRDNGFRPHTPRSLVKEPDIEGYQRNLLLQPPKNIWEEPRKYNIWDDTFKKKKSIFEK